MSPLQETCPLPSDKLITPKKNLTVVIDQGKEASSAPLPVSGSAKSWQIFVGEDVRYSLPSTPVGPGGTPTASPISSDCSLSPFSSPVFSPQPVSRGQKEGPPLSDNQQHYSLLCVPKAQNLCLP